MRLKHFVLGMVTTLSLHARGSLLGNYILDVTIYGTKYTDHLEIKEVATSQNEPGISVIKGFFEVPGSFRSPFEGTVRKDQMRLSFLADEGDEPFKVNLSAKIEENGTLTGELMTGGSRFGMFKGVKSEQHD